MSVSASNAFKYFGGEEGGGGLNPEDIHQLDINHTLPNGNPAQESYNPLFNNQSMNFGRVNFKRNGTTVDSYDPFDTDKDVELGAEIDSAQAPLKIVGKKITNNGSTLTVTGINAWAEGNSTKATGDCSHAEGSGTEATNSCTHAEGNSSKATSMYAHSEGSGTEASGVASHAEGVRSKATGTYAHAEGMETVAGGTASHTEGEGTRTTKTGGSACGRFNDAQDALFVVGNGTDDNNRKDAFKIDEFGNAWALMGGVLTRITGHNYKIYETLQSAISDAANLSVGEYFETNGFHTDGDGGAARYLVSSTGTANGKNIVQLASGKLAILQVDDSLYPEQLGLLRGDNTYNLGDYILHANSMGKRHIKLFASSSPYYMTSTCNITSPDITIEGGLNVFSGYSTRIEWTGASGNMFNLEHRRLTFKHLYLNNSSGNSGAICFNSSTNNGNHFKYVLDNLHISGFGVGVSFTNDTHWMHYFKDVTFAACSIGCSFEKFLLCCKFVGLYFNGCTEYDIKFQTEATACHFDNCNFGVLKHGLQFKYYSGADNIRFGQVEFTSCSFEFDTDNSSIVNRSGFIDVEDKVCIILSFTTCNFSYQRYWYNGYNSSSDARCMSFGNQTRVSFRGCQGAKLNEYAYRKQLFNEQRPPALELGSLKIIDNCWGIEAPSYDSPYSDVCILTDRSEIELVEHYGTNLFDKNTSWVLNGISMYQDGADVVYESSGSGTTRTLVIPIPAYWNGKTLTFSFDGSSRNRFGAAYSNFIPTGNTRSSAPFIGSASILTTVGTREKFSITVNDNYKFILIYYANNISDDSLFPGSFMVTEDGSATPYVSYSVPSTEKRLIPSLIDLDSLVSMLNARGNSLV